MKYEETIVNEPEYVKEIHSLEIPCNVIYDKNSPEHVTISTTVGKMRMVSQGKSIEDAKANIKKSFDASMGFYERQFSLLNKRAIWLSNYSKHGKGFSLWFKILGLGLTINYMPNRNTPFLSKNRNPIKFIGINNAGGLVIKNLLIFATNAWRTKDKEQK